MRRLMPVLALIAVLSVAPAASASAASAKPNIVEVAASSPRFSTLVKLVKRAKLVKALSGDTKLTVFAPTNRAFDRVPRKTLRHLKRHRKQLRQVLLYHVLAGGYPAQRVVKRDGAKTLLGQRVRFSVRRSKVFVNNARVVLADVKASNGIVHGINRVLIPSG